MTPVTVFVVGCSVISVSDIHCVNFVFCETHNTLVNNFANRTLVGDVRFSGDVHCNIVTDTEAVASVIASTQPIRCDKVASNALWMRTQITLAIIGGGDTQSIHWAALQIPNKLNAELSFYQNTRKWNLYPLLLFGSQRETSCWIRIQNFHNLSAIILKHRGHRCFTLWFQMQKCGLLYMKLTDILKNKHLRNIHKTILCHRTT